MRTAAQQLGRKSLRAVPAPVVLQAMWYQIEALANKTGAMIGAPAASNCGVDCITASPFDWCVRLKVMGTLLQHIPVQCMCTS